MKVSYRGRVRKINVIPADMNEFKRVVQQKFLNCHLMAPDEEVSGAMSRVLDDTDLQGDNSSFANLLNEQISQRAAAADEAEESKVAAGSRRSKREKNTVDFATSVCFYEDSEGDFNVLSEDEDLADATTYMLQHNQKAIKCSIVSKQFFEDLRLEQTQSDLNQSITWQSSALNRFQPKAKKEKKAGKQKRKENDEIPASMMSKIDEMVRARVDAEMAAKLQEQSRAQETASAQQRESAKTNNSERPSVDYDEALYRQQRPQMACLLSSDFMNVQAMEGREVSIEFQVENRSSMAWPFKPFIQNEKDKSVKQIVDAQLQPGEQTTVRYVFRAPLQQDQRSVHMLLQLVEPRAYEKFCDDTIVVIVNVQSSQEGDSMFGLGMSMVEDSDMRFSKGEEEDEGAPHQMLVDRIDQVLTQNNRSSIYEQESIDEGRSMVEGLMSPSSAQPAATEEDDIITTTRKLLAQLKNEQSAMDDANEEESKDSDHKAQLAKLGNLIDKADQFRQQNP